jgi:thiol-disulfide isomerase/thioredoxin
MEREAFLPGRKLILGTVVLTAAIAAPPNAFSADRVVLMEQFTATTCPPCNTAAPHIGNLIDTYGVDGTGTLAVVEFHLGDQVTVPWGQTRASYYHVTGIPDFWYDGVLEIYGWTGAPAQLNAYQTRLAIPTTVTMDITVQETGARDYRTIVEVCLEDGAPTTLVTVYTVMMEDHYTIPPTNPVSRNTFRYAAPTSNVRLSPGQCVPVVNDFLNIAPMVSEENFKFAAWAQTPNASAPAEVYQAAITGYPFSPPCPADCNMPPNGEVNVSDFLALLSQWGNVGSSCDIDGGGVGVTDFLTLLAQWGPCPVD